MSTQPPPAPDRRYVMLPLAGNLDGHDALALGVLLAKLLGDHLAAAGLRVVDDRRVATALKRAAVPLPLEDEALTAVRKMLGADVAISGEYVVDDTGKMLGLQLMAAGLSQPSPPFEASSPFSAFPRFVERLALALLERLGHPVDDRVRARLRSAPRPASFEAFRQVASAHAAWNQGQNELALTAISSALALDPDYEDAMTIEVAVARAAGDTETVRTAFRRWAEAAVKRGAAAEGAERQIMAGHWLKQRGEWQSARQAYEAARSLLERRSDERSTARAANNLAGLDLIAGDVQPAIRTYRRSLRVFEDDPTAERDTAATLLNLALAHKLLGQREEASMAADRALGLARHLQDATLEAQCLAQRAGLHDDAGEWGQADVDYRQAIRLLDSAGDAAAMAAVQTQRAVLFKHQGDYLQAEAVLVGAIASLRAAGGLHEQAIAWHNLADLYFAMQRYEDAWPLAERALEAFRRLKSDWVHQTEGLLEALEEAMPPAPEPPVGHTPRRTDEAGERYSAPFPGEDPLYSDKDLYNNEATEEGNAGGDGELNSSAGRTPMM